MEIEAPQVDTIEQQPKETETQEVPVVEDQPSKPASPAKEDEEEQEEVYVVEDIKDHRKDKVRLLLSAILNFLLEWLQVSHQMARFPRCR